MPKKVQKQLFGKTQPPERRLWSNYQTTDNPRKTMRIPPTEYTKLMSRQGTCVIEGKRYRRLPNGSVTTGEDIVVTTASPGAVVQDTRVLVYYRLLPPPPPKPPPKQTPHPAPTADGAAQQLSPIATTAQYA